MQFPDIWSDIAADTKTTFLAKNSRPSEVFVNSASVAIARRTILLASGSGNLNDRASVIVVKNANYPRLLLPREFRQELCRTQRQIRRIASQRTKSSSHSVSIRSSVCVFQFMLSMSFWSRFYINVPFSLVFRSLVAKTSPTTTGRRVRIGQLAINQTINQKINQSISRNLRKMAFRQFVSYTQKTKLGYKKRIILLSCVVSIIRQTFPNVTTVPATGYRDAALLDDSDDDVVLITKWNLLPNSLGIRFINMQQEKTANNWPIAAVHIGNSSTFAVSTVASNEKHYETPFS